MSDFRYALRRILQQPGFAAVVVITLALGIGASTAIFSVVNAVLLRPLPFANSERLQVVWGNYRALNIERLPAKAAEYETFFTKPLDPDKILAVVSDVLGARRSKANRDQALARALDEARRSEE